ncbi:uncharacterized protein [Pseudorasbora parva]|uniref:uncharacterized protein n=1 Tax=Pseudorasbora parva TaxID=51549 RepID=UPI00351E3511
MDQKTTNQDDNSISGYLHSISPIKISRANNRYFNAILQVSRNEYHDTVVFAMDKHDTFSTAAKNKTPVKLKNAKKSISIRDKEDFDVQYVRDTTIEVTEVPFPHKPPQNTSTLTIQEIKSMTSRKLITRLEASVQKMDITSSTVTIRDNNCEVRSCCLADATGSITLSLWDSQIDLVEEGRTYTFTNLSTRQYNDNTTLTTTRLSTITPLHKKITVQPSTTTQTPPPTLHTVTTEITGAAITIKKQCPKCHTAQQNLTYKEKFHRCTVCKILRKGSSYITKCSGFLTILQDRQEMSLTITNSQLTKFVNIEHNVTLMDSQDIEEYFMTCGPLTLTFTEDSQILDLQTQAQQPTTPEQNVTDEELTSVIVEIPADQTLTISHTEQTDITLSPKKDPKYDTKKRKHKAV